MTPDPAALPGRFEAPDPLLRAEGISVVLGGREILENVDIAVGPGEIVTLIGPNGAGKTTLVRVILGQLRADAGTVRRRVGLRLGYLPQRFGFDATLPLTLRGFLNLPRPKPAAQLRAALAEVGLAETLDRAVQELSGGEVRRLLLARALLREPDLLLLDEPLQGVDFGGQIALFQLIAEVRRKRGCGVLMVSHDLHLVMAGTDRVICLNRHVCCSGAPDSVSRHPEYLSLFGPKAAEGLAVYAHQHDHSHDLSGEVTVEPEAGETTPPRPASPGDES